MVDASVSRLARWLVTRRAWVLVATASLTLIGLVGLLRLEADPSPKKLRASWGNQDAVWAEFTAAFGDSDRVLLVLVEADDVLTLAPLQHAHSIARRLASLEGIVQVDGVTVTPLPHRGASDSHAAPADAALTDELLGGRAADPGSAALEAELLGGTPAPAAAPSGDDDERKLRTARLVAPIVEGDLAHFPEGLASLAARAEETGLRGGPLVVGAEVTAADVPRIRAAVESSGLLRGRLVGRGGRVTVVAATLDPKLHRYADWARVVGGVDQALAELPAPAGVTVLTGGLPQLQHEIVGKLRHDQARLIPGTVLVCMLILGLLLRGWTGVVLPLAAVGITLLILLGGMGVAGVPMNVINNTLPTLLIVIGISDSIHLIARYRDELRHGRTREHALDVTVSQMAMACLLTSVTTAVGFASLVLASTPMLRLFGVVAAIGVMIAYAATMAFVPSVLFYATRGKPAAPPPTTTGAPGVDGRPTRTPPDFIERGVAVLTRWVLRRPWPVIVASAALLVGAGWLATGVRADMRLLDQFDPHEEPYRITRLLEAELQGVRPLEIHLKASDDGALFDPAVAAAIQGTLDFARTRPGVLGTDSWLGVLREVAALVTGDAAERDALPRSREVAAALAAVAGGEAELGAADPAGGASSGLRRFLTVDGREGRATVFLADIGARASNELIDAIAADLAERLAAHPGVKVQLTGEAFQGSRGISAVIWDLFSSILMASGIIFVLLTLLFRSVRLGLLAVPPNVLPLVATLAWMAARGIQLSVGTVIIFSISIGLAVDGSIHVVARYREELARGLGRDFALLRAARGTGRAIVITNIALALGFSVLLTSSFVTIRQFGELIAVTMLWCLASTAVLQPALLRLGTRPTRSRPAAPPPASTT